MVAGMRMLGCASRGRSTSTDTTSAGSKTTHYLLSVVDDQGWPRIEQRTPTERLDRQASPQGEPDVSLAQSTIFFAGRRTVLGHVDGANGSTEIAMVTR